MKKKKKPTKINAMCREYGENEGSFCRNCCNYRRSNIGDKSRFKCIAYGTDSTPDTDWNGSWTGCGMYNMPQPQEEMPVGTRRKLLKDIGTANFNDKLARAKEQEKKEAERKAIFDLLNTVAEPIAEQENDMLYIKSIFNLEAAQKFAEEEREGDYYYIPSDYAIWIYRRPTEEEIKQRNEKAEAEAKAKQEKDAKRAEYEAVREHYYKLRYDFVVNGGAGIKSNLPVISEMLTKGALSDNYIRIDQDELLEMFDFEFDDAYSEDYDEDEVRELYLKDMQEQFPERFALYVGYLMFDDSKSNGYHSYYELEHSSNSKLDTLYELLEKLGYERSDEEKAYCDGTHELFKSKDGE